MRKSVDGREKSEVMSCGEMTIMSGCVSGRENE